MVEAKIIIDFFKMLNESNLNYVLIKNDDNVLPNCLESDNDIDFLIHPIDYEKLIELCVSNGYEKKVGESCKRYFLEQLREDLLFKYDDCYFHFYEALPCSPLTNMGDCKMALERSVQEYIWEHKVWNEINQWWIMDDIAILLYLIVRSVFDKKEFKEKYIREIEKRKQLLDKEDFKRLAQTVFFGFTPMLIELVKAGKYEHVLGKYLSYSNY